VQAAALVDDQVNVELPPLATLVGLALSDTPGAGAATVTVADWEAEPPAPLQVSVYVVVAVRAPVLWDPLVGSLPLQPPDAVQEVAFVDDHVSVAAAPLLTVLGLAEKATVGAGVVTVTVTDCAALPPVPLHVRVYVEVLVSAPVDCEPLVGSEPDHAPEAVQEVALVADQLNVELPPLATDVGLALKVTTGPGALTVTVADWVALPPAPLHVRVYVEVLVSAPVDCEPLVASDPDHAPEAVQEAALVEDQVRVALAPLAIVLGLTLKVMVGAGALTVTVTDCMALPPVPLQSKT